MQSVDMALKTRKIKEKENKQGISMHEMEHVKGIRHAHKCT